MNLADVYEILITKERVSIGLEERYISIPDSQALEMAECIYDEIKYLKRLRQTIDFYRYIYI